MDTSSDLVDLLTSKVGAEILKAESGIDCAVIWVAPEKLKSLAHLLKLDAQFQFQMLLSVTAVDWMDKKDHRFEVVYHFVSIVLKQRLRIKIAVPETKSSVPTLCDIWSSANFMEREVYDMYGILFEGHPDLRRILMYEEFVGFPLRKDYPLQGKQPRIPLRSPEVRNTAVDMRRPDLVSIRQRSKAA